MTPDPAIRALGAELSALAPAPGDEAVGTLIADAVGAFAVGAATPEGRALAALERALAGDGTSPAWSRGVLDDVVVRAAVTRLTELDDIHMSSCTTPGSVVVPTAITLAAALNRPDRLAAAIEAGYEAMTRLGRAVDGAHAVYRGLWPTLFAAAFATAAAASRLLALDGDRTAAALTLALAGSTGTSLPAGPRSARWLAVGEAARSGALAARAARQGFEAALPLDRFAAAARLDLDAGALGAPGARAVETVSVKPFPCAKQTVAAVTAALALRDRVAPDRVEAITVLVPEPVAGLVSMPASPDARLSRIASAGWNVALALLRPEALADVERSVSADDADVERLAALVEVRGDAALTERYPQQWPARVEVRLAGGERVVESVAEATGDPAAALGPADAADEKWRAIYGPALGADAPRWRRLAAGATRTPQALRELDELARQATGGVG